MSSIVLWGYGLRLALTSVGAISLVGCVGQAVVGEETPEDEEPGGDGDEGDGDEGDGDHIECSGEDAVEEPKRPGPPMNDFSNLADTVWEGYIEGSDDELTLVLGADGTGTYYVGEARAFDPPTDPDAGYICESEVIDTLPCSMEPLEGFQYSVQDASLVARRLQFSVRTTEPWNEWCALQTPSLSLASCRYTPVPHGYGYPSYNIYDGCTISNADGSQSEQVDCGWANLAGPFTCECNSEECFARPWGASFDLTANEEFTELSNAMGMRLFLVE